MLDANFTILIEELEIFHISEKQTTRISKLTPNQLCPRASE